MKTDKQYMSKRYIKHKPNRWIDFEYILNEEFYQKNGMDLRDIMIPKMISRLETVKEVAQKEIENKSSLTTDVYARHRDKNSSLDSSFTKENYGEFGFAPLFDEYRLEKMNLAIKDKDVYFTEYNEVGVVPLQENKNQEWVLPKRLIFNVQFLDMQDEDTVNKYILEFCEANTKFYKSDIRILDESNKKTCVVSARQFKDILSNNKEFYNLLTEETKQKLDEMIKICEQKNIVQDNIVGKQTNNLYNNEQKEVKNKTDKVDCKCCNIF